MKKIPYKTFKKIVDNMPILCVDILCRHKGKFLLLKRKNKPVRGKFWVPGGRVFKGEKLRHAVIRKMKEEAGINVKIIKAIGFFEGNFQKNEFNSKTGYHGVCIIFLAEPLSLKIKLDEQSSDWKFSKKLPKLYKINYF